MNLKALLRSLCYRWSTSLQPKMVYGFTRGDGVFLKRTRVSNMTRIEDVAQLVIEDNVYIGHFNLIDASGGLYIGEGCQITNYVSLLTHSSHVAIRLYGDRYLESKNHVGYLKKLSRIGPYSFIGPHSVLMPGVVLGKGSMVSAYSYISAGVYPNFAIFSGNPARVVGDTRELDAHWLEGRPELLSLYDAWADD